MVLVRLGLITVVNNRTCVWIIRGGCKSNDVVKRVAFMPCHFYTSVGSFGMFGHMPGHTHCLLRDRSAAPVLLPVLLCCLLLEQPFDKQQCLAEQDQ